VDHLLIKVDLHRVMAEAMVLAETVAMVAMVETAEMDL
jgi:hypothetical protein